MQSNAQCRNYPGRGACIKGSRGLGSAYLDERSLPPLAGLPVLIKDNQRTEGIRTTLGSARHLDTIPQQDAGIVRRLRAAGAIVVGKTNIPEYSIGANTVNPVFGATGNPFDPAMTCGGSSGGSAVAVAADMVKLATGSDHGGSLESRRVIAGSLGLEQRPALCLTRKEERRAPTTVSRAPLPKPLKMQH